jgi:hypothetical protein
LNPVPFPAFRNICMATCLATRPVRQFSNLPEYCPSPAEIRAACLEIQREWSPEERASRRTCHSGFALLRLEFLPDGEHPTRPPERSRRTYGGRLSDVRTSLD